VDRSVGAAPRDVGGRVGRARGAGYPGAGSDHHGLRTRTVRPRPDGGVPQAPARASRWLRRRSPSLEDFNALAMTLALGMADVRGCLILSRDGLVLGAHPAESERTTTRAWIRFATIGDPERGFVQAANHGPTRNRYSSPSTRRTRGRKPARPRASEPGSSPRTRPKSRTATSTDSRSRGSSVGCFRGERTGPMVRRHPGTEGRSSAW
jgi:hypothetical protein